MDFQDNIQEKKKWTNQLATTWGIWSWESVILEKEWLEYHFVWAQYDYPLPIRCPDIHWHLIHYQVLFVSGFKNVDIDKGEYVTILG